eukprot:scaffold64553_cov36-Cyclotella_meneghiniana.AAC.2
MKLNKAVEGVVMSVQAPTGSEITDLRGPERVSSAHVGACVEGDPSDCVEIQERSDGYLQCAVYAPSVVSSVIDVGDSTSQGALSSYVGGGDGYDSDFLLRRDVTGRVCVFDKRTGDSNVDGCRKVIVMLDCGLVGEDKVGRCVGLCEGMKFVDGITGGGTPGLLCYCYTAGGAIDWDGTATNVVDNVGAKGNDLYYDCNRFVEGRPHLAMRGGLEAEFVGSYMNNFQLFGEGLGKDEFLRTLVDVGFLKAILLRGTVAVVLDGLTNCKCRGEAAEHYWLGAGKCGECLGRSCIVGEGGKAKACLSHYGGFVGRRGVSRSLEDAAIICDAIRRSTWFLMPMNSRDLELIVTNPITRMLSYTKAAMRDLAREIDLLSYETMGRLTPPLIQGLVYARKNYWSNQDIYDGGVYFDGVRVPVYKLFPEFWYHEEGREVPVILGGPYDYDSRDGMHGGRVSSSLCVSMLTTLGAYDVLGNHGLYYRPVVEGALPFVYHGAYGKEGHPYSDKTGDWGTNVALRKEEGPGMRYHIDFGLYDEERRAANRDGKALEVVRREIIEGWHGGISWEEGRGNLSPEFVFDKLMSIVKTCLNFIFASLDDADGGNSNSDRASIRLRDMGRRLLLFGGGLGGALQLLGDGGLWFELLSEFGLLILSVHVAEATFERIRRHVRVVYDLPRPRVRAWGCGLDWDV